MEGAAASRFHQHEEGERLPLGLEGSIIFKNIRRGGGRKLGRGTSNPGSLNILCTMGDDAWIHVSFVVSGDTLALRTLLDLYAGVIAVSDMHGLGGVLG